MYFSILQGMREEAIFHVVFEKLRASSRKLEISYPWLPRKRNVLSHYEEEEAPVEFVSTVKGDYRQVLYQAIEYLPTLRLIK